MLFKSFRIHEPRAYVENFNILRNLSENCVYIKILYVPQVRIVQTEIGLSQWFQVESAICHECLLSPMLFAILIDLVNQAFHFRAGGQLSSEQQLHDHEFENNVDHVAHCQDAIQHNLQEL